MHDILKKLTAKKKRLDRYRPLPPELVKNLDEWFDIELIYNSNALEGNSLTREETAQIIKKWREDKIQGSNQAHNHEQSNQFYTTEEAASLLKVDPESIRRYVRRGKLRAVKLGGKFIRIERKDLDSFIEGLKIPP